MHIPTHEDILAALQTDAVARRILAKGTRPDPGQLVGVRLNINVLKRTGVAAHSIHKATSLDGHRHGKGFYRGEVISYAPLVQLREAFFNVHQGAREGIARGTAAKSPMASVDGAYIPAEGVARFDGVEIRFNPKTTHLFVDLEGFAVRYAEEVTVLGHRVFARGRIQYFTELDAPARAGDAPTQARFKPADQARKADHPTPRLVRSAPRAVDLFSDNLERQLLAA
jgi:hypothetical protein